MTFLYVSTVGNKIRVVQVDEVGNLIKVVQTVDHIVDPLPPGCDKLKPGPFATEWITKHPKYSLLFALTSFWHRHNAILTTFRIDSKTGKLTKLSSCVTGGYQAAQGTVSPDGSTYAVCHHNDGRIAFFDISKDEGVTKPLRVIRVPELVPGKFVEPFDTRIGIGCPCVHGLNYAPNGTYFVVAEAQQTGAITYRCDVHGRPIVNDDDDDDETITPHSHVITTTHAKPYGWFISAIDYAILDSSPRVRRAVVHPNGKYLYLLYEVANTIQVFSIDETGAIGNAGGCLQEIKVFGQELARKEWWIGIAATVASELIACENYLIASVRGLTPAGGKVGKAESCVQFLRYMDDGARLELAEKVETPQAVRHFYREQEKEEKVLWVGMNSAEYPYVQKYAVKSDDGEGGLCHELTGEANVDVDVMCVVPVAEDSLR